MRLSGNDARYVREVLNEDCFKVRCITKLDCIREISQRSYQEAKKRAGNLMNIGADDGWG